MTRQSSREKVARYRQRLRRVGELPLPRCERCGRAVRGTRTLPWCFACWQRTPAGKAAEAERKRRARNRDRS